MLLAVFFALCLVYYLYWALVEKRHPEGFPPAPRLKKGLVMCLQRENEIFFARFPLPSVGDTLGIKPKLPYIEAFRAKYGDIFGFWDASKRTVVVSSLELIQVRGSRSHIVLTETESAINNCKSLFRK